MEPTKNQTHSDESERPLTAREAASYLGISLSHLHRLCSTGRIAFYKTAGGKLSRFLLVDLQRWVLARRIPSNDEVERDILAEEIAKGR